MGVSLADVKLHRNDKVRTMANKEKTVKVRGKITEVNPSILFNIIMCVMRNKSDIRDFFKYELAPQPPSLFYEGIMRKTQKSVLRDTLNKFVAHESTFPEDKVFVLDGGHLLHTVIWPTPSTFAEVCQTHILYVLNNFGAGSIVYSMDTTVLFQRRLQNRIGGHSDTYQVI